MTLSMEFQCTRIDVESVICTSFDCEFLFQWNEVKNIKKKIQITYNVQREQQMEQRINLIINKDRWRKNRDAKNEIHA